MAAKVDLYNTYYDKFAADAQGAVRAETYGEDIGQSSWMTAHELRHFIELLKIDASTNVLEVGSGSGGQGCGGGGQRLLGTSDQFNDERGQKTIVSKIKLDKKSFGVNKQLLMTIENKGTVYASARFKILGQGDKFTGKVNFSEDEAEGKDSDDSAKQK